MMSSRLPDSPDTVAASALPPLMRPLPSYLAARQSNPVFPAGRWITPTPDAPVIPPEIVRKALEVLQSVVGAEGNSGTMIVHRGYLLWAGENVSHKGHVWSCTKSINSICLGLLWDDGRCSPDDLAARYLPSLARDYPEVTLRHMATFTSGIHLEALSLDPGPPNFAVGAAMHYSQELDLLAYILTRIAGEPLSELFRRRIADPIGMSPAGWEWKSVNTRDGLPINGGAGMPENGMYMTAENLARLGWLFANNGKWDGRELISKRYIEHACVARVSPHTPMHDPADWYHQLPGRYGLSWWTNGVDSTGRRLWPSAPDNTFAAQGNNNNICIIVPEWQLVIVRTAQDKVIDVALFDGVFKALSETPRS
ncbi:CubicO group peptidase, beta-lactamase class C family [Terrimicrobium sacchariphilum]|uniref:CubicO group peptidase, beta-lactamase class C family n=1 Tax=Terrimicrobium sacchariphilum TaxID=690879 RepID=A0A146G679_TERSA|nr:serine hydrolase [Terrimicrobium sacchariphilum]GAT32226.1 CubicO group peptidase, beta-lactamase class C family [Terrimicrobium sacchariphilum]